MFPFVLSHRKMGDNKNCFLDFTAQKIKFSIKDFPSKCDEIRMKHEIERKNYQHLLRVNISQTKLDC